ncbi:MAG: monovalent cation/H+ antiporter subunit D family protein [Hyphomicrobiaceae bacterium]
MMALESHLPILQVIVPLFGALITAFMRRGTLAWLSALIVCWAAAAISVLLLIRVLTVGAPVSYVMGDWGIPWGIEYRVDAFNAFVLTVVTGIAAVLMPYARKSVAFEIAAHQQAWFYSMFLLCLTGLLGIAVTGDAFNVFVFLEISSLSTYVLIALGHNRRALLASYQYLIIGTIGATFYVIGIGLIYLVTGSLNLHDISGRLAEAYAVYPHPVMTGLAFLIVGISLKLALFPLHVWLPNAYAHAPSAATVFLAGTATKVAVYLLIRILFSMFGVAIDFNELPVADVLIVLSVAAMFIASFAAVFEENAKRMLAYSSVAQIGYITLGIGLANQSGLTGSIVHMLNHAVTKATLFMCLGAIVCRTASMRFTDLAGIGRKMPLTSVAFVLAGLSLIGVPGTAGFISKWYLAVGALDKGYWSLVFLIVLSSLIAVIYIGRFVEIAYFRDPSPCAANAHEPTASMLIPTLLLAAATVYFGLDTRASADIAAIASQQLLGGLK